MGEHPSNRSEASSAWPGARDTEGRRDGALIPDPRFEWSARTADGPTAQDCFGLFLPVELELHPDDSSARTIRLIHSIERPGSLRRSSTLPSHVVFSGVTAASSVSGD